MRILMAIATALLLSHAAQAQRPTVDELAATFGLKLDIGEFSFPRRLSVEAFGAKCDGRADDTAALRAATDAVPPEGATVVFPSQRTCIVSDQIGLRSNTRIQGDRSTIKGTDGSRGAFVIHGNQSRIEINGMRFVWPVGHPEVHIITLHSGASDVVIRGNESVGAGNFTAVIGARRVVTIDNKVTDVSNACLDHWGSYNDVYVVGNTCATTNRKVKELAGIQLTGMTTDYKEAHASGALVAYNTVYFNSPTQGQAIMINGADRGGANDRIVVTRNNIFMGPGVRAWGILVTGHSGSGIISLNYLDGNHGTYSAVGVFGPQASRWTIEQNQTANWLSGQKPLFDAKESKLFGNITADSVH
jgi:hypothetical protein